jgi:hypothetical protein
MPVSEVYIANRALQAAGGEGRLSDFSEATAATDREAQLVLAHFEEARDETLSDADWPFARHSADLADVSEDERHGWSYAYAYPANCLVLRKVTAQDSKTPTPYSVKVNEDGTSKIVNSNTAPAVAVYTRLITDPNMWSAWFRSALAYRLAIMLLNPLTGKTDAKVETKLERQYGFARSRAMIVGHQEVQEDPDDAPLATWEESRE